MTAVSAPTVANWTSRGRNTVLDEPRPVDVVHNGAWYRGDLTATRYELDAGCRWASPATSSASALCTGTGSTRTSCGGRRSARRRSPREEGGRLRGLTGQAISRRLPDSTGRPLSRGRPSKLLLAQENEPTSQPRKHHQMNPNVQST